MENKSFKTNKTYEILEEYLIFINYEWNQAQNWDPMKAASASALA